MCNFNVRKLIEDIGGPVEVASITGKSRTEPYRWINKNKISTEILGRIACNKPDIDLNKYVERGNDE